MTETNKTTDGGLNLQDTGGGGFESNSGSKGIDLTQEKVEQMISASKPKFLEDALFEAKELVREQIQTDKSSLITVFGLFASIISFLTIEFQFLKTICDSGVILGFTFILFGMLTFFNLSLDSLIGKRFIFSKKQSGNEINNGGDGLRILLLVFAILSIFIGLYLYITSDKKSCDYIDKIKLEQLENKIVEQNDKLKANMEQKINDSIKNENNKINDLILKSKEVNIQK